MRENVVIGYGFDPARTPRTWCFVRIPVDELVGLVDRDEDLSVSTYEPKRWYWPYYMGLGRKPRMQLHFNLRHDRLPPPHFSDDEVGMEVGNGEA